MGGMDVTQAFVFILSAAAHPQPDLLHIRWTCRGCSTLPYNTGENSVGSHVGECSGWRSAAGYLQAAQKVLLSLTMAGMAQLLKQRFLSSLQKTK